MPAISVAAGWRSFTTGSPISANLVRRGRVSRLSRSKRGNSFQIAANSRLRRAVTAQSRSDCTIRFRSCPSRSLIASKKSPVAANVWLTASDCAFSSRRMSSDADTNSGRFPNSALMSAPRPWAAAAWDCIQVWKAARVSSSKERKISSSSTVAATAERGSVPPSGSMPVRSLPAVRSTKVSPSSVFVRSIARASRGTGA